MKIFVNYNFKFKLLLKNMAHYGKVEYWEDRYDKDREQYDWYQRYTGVKDMITQYITRDTKILMLGCGNAKLSEEMFNDGFKNIENVDISNTVITQ
jgi:2-polyprenyl-3-methyl-5-hydroxy-6-metoxy-1,4-benzoquinol methylase